jgi:D-threo-aldose 1-dehydrogenase
MAHALQPPGLTGIDQLRPNAGVITCLAEQNTGGALAKGAGYGRITYQETDAAGMAPVRMLEELCAQHGVDLGAAALHFSMRDPRIATTLVGTARPEGVARNLAWAETAVPDALWEDLAGMPVSTEDPEANRIYRPG